MNASLFIFIAAALVSAFLLVVLYRQEEKLGRPPSDPEAHWLARPRAIVFPIARTAFGHGLAAMTFAMLIVAVWAQNAPQFGLPSLPPETAAFIQLTQAYDPEWFVKAPRILAQTSLLHYVAIGLIVVFFLNTTWRCLGSHLYDIFISYKSEDVAVARRIADALIAAGWNVWFAEYRILLERRAQFTPLFGLGAVDSWYSLLITNDRWAKSKHCAREARLMLATMGPQRMFELRAPSQKLPHQYFPGLAKCAALETTDPAQVLKFVEARTNLLACPEQFLPLPAPVSAGRRFTSYYDGRATSLDVGEWDLFGDPASLEKVHWGCKHLPEGVLDGVIVIHARKPEELAREKRWGLGEEFMFDVMAHYGRKVMKQHKFRARGVHLLFYQDRPQMGLTYWAPNPDAWHRDIFLDALNTVTGAAATFHFKFRFKGSFRDYCRHAHVMDELALSLQWT